MDRFEKQPREHIEFAWDFSEKLQTGDSLASIISTEVIEFPLSTGATLPVLANTVISPTAASVMVSVGQHGKRYKLTAVVLTAVKGETLEHDFLLRVRDL